MNEHSLAEILNAGNVLRTHTIQCLDHPTIAHHTWRTLTILHWLYDSALPPAGLTYALLMHDVPEHYTGDTPGNAKQDEPDLAKALDSLEELYFKNHGVKIPYLQYYELLLMGVCDRADLVLYCLDEIEMGNNKVRPMAMKGFNMFKEKYSLFRKSTIELPRVDILNRILTHRVDVML